MSKERNAIHKLSAGTVLNNRYEIIDLLGAGGFGNTYLARDTRFSATTLHVCVKEFFLSGVASRAADGRTIMLTDPTQAQNYEDGRLRFRREAERMFTLRDEHIVRVSDLFDENGTSYYVMDYIAGQSLAGLIQQRGACSEPEALAYILQLLQGLRVIHSVGMVHLDIKPGNVMIDKSGKVVLIDFGASKIIENGSATLSAAILTTPGYAPLEQALCQLDRIGEWTDLYAVGGTLYKLLSGRTPATSQAIIDEGRSAFDFPAETSNATRELIFWLMNERISNRPHSTEEVITRVEALLEELKEGNHAAETPSASSDDIPGAIPLIEEKVVVDFFTTPPSGAQTFPPRNGQVSPADPAAGSSATTPQGVPPSAAKPTAAPQGNASPTPAPAATMPSNQPAAATPNNPYASPFPIGGAVGGAAAASMAAGMRQNPAQSTPPQAGNQSSQNSNPSTAPSYDAPSHNGLNVPPPPQGANAMGTNASQPPMAGSLDNLRQKGRACHHRPKAHRTKEIHNNLSALLKQQATMRLETIPNHRCNRKWAIPPTMKRTYRGALRPTRPLQQIAPLHGHQKSRKEATRYGSSSSSPSSSLLSLQPL